MGSGEGKPTQSYAATGAITKRSWLANRHGQETTPFATLSSAPSGSALTRSPTRATTMNRASIILRTIALLVASGALLIGQTPAYLKQVKALHEAMKGKSAFARIKAVKAFQDCGDAAGVKILIGHLSKSLIFD